MRISLEKRIISSPIKHERNAKQDLKTKTVSPRLETEVDITIVKQAENRSKTKVKVDVNASMTYDQMSKSNRGLEEDQRSLDTLGIRQSIHN